MKAGPRRISLQTALLGLVLPLVAGTGLVVTSVMANRMEALAIHSTEKQLKTNLDAIIQRWEKIRGPNKTFGYFRSLDEQLQRDQNYLKEYPQKTILEILDTTNNNYVTSLIVLLPNGSLFQAKPVNKLKKYDQSLPADADLLTLTRNPNSPEISLKTFNKNGEELSSWNELDPEWKINSTGRWNSAKKARKNPRNIRVNEIARNDLTGRTATLSQEFASGNIFQLEIDAQELKAKLDSLRESERSKLIISDMQSRLIISAGDLTKNENGTPINQSKDTSIRDLEPIIKSHIEKNNRQVPSINLQDVKLGGERWFVAVSTINSARDGGKALLVKALPRDEVLAPAIASARQAQFATLLLVIATMPVVWLASRKLIKALKDLAVEAPKLNYLNSEASHPVAFNVSEIEVLGATMHAMQDTIQRFLETFNALSSERDFNRLLQLITRSSVASSGAMGVIIDIKNSKKLDEPKTIRSPKDFIVPSQAHMLELPLSSSHQASSGTITLIFDQQPEPYKIAFCKALASSAAVAIEKASLLQSQKDMLDSFIRLVAGAINDKSPYTGSHCSRVAELTQWLAKAACDCEEPEFSGFKMTENDKEVLHLAASLHDCGKIVTPEYVLDKATKLETVHNRIHELRMRFELIKAQAESNYWQKCSTDTNTGESLRELNRIKQDIDSDFAFIANCNIGGEAMLDEDIERLHQIGQRTWIRTLDNRLGLSAAEHERLALEPIQQLPCDEPLLSDQASQRISRSMMDSQPAKDDQRFNLNIPKLLQNNGEIYNLSIRRGTLNDEERFITKFHAIETIRMLESLELPQHLAEAPAIAGGHHEQMDGKGYPCGLKRDDLPLQTRMMSIADVFESLTDNNRPYKPAKTLSAVMKIMVSMVNQHRLDPDLFRLFVKEGLHHQYAERYLTVELRDDIDDALILASIAP